MSLWEQQCAEYCWHISAAFQKYPSGQFWCAGTFDFAWKLVVTWSPQTVNGARQTLPGILLSRVSFRYQSASIRLTFPLLPCRRRLDHDNQFFSNFGALAYCVWAPMHRPWNTSVDSAGLVLSQWPILKGSSWHFCPFRQSTDIECLRTWNSLLWSFCDLHHSPFSTKTLRILFLHASVIRNSGKAYGSILWYFHFSTASGFPFSLQPESALSVRLISRTVSWFPFPDMREFNPEIA
jgi:hypothetical protein